LPGFTRRRTGRSASVRGKADANAAACSAAPLRGPRPAKRRIPSLCGTMW